MNVHEIEIKGEMDRLILICRALVTVDLDGVIATIGRADALMPFVDPTAYRDMLYRKGNMHDLENLARAALPLAKAWREVRLKLGMEEVE